MSGFDPAGLPAFPGRWMSKDETKRGFNQGLCRDEYLLGQALAGLLANTKVGELGPKRMREVLDTATTAANEVADARFKRRQHARGPSGAEGEASGW